DYHSGQLYWIRKLLLVKMENDNILEHVDTMAKYHERLNFLVTPAKPLTPDDVHSAALISSIPQDWLHYVFSLMNQDGVKTEAIFLALKNKYTRRQSQPDNPITVSLAKTKLFQPKHPGENNKKPRHCVFCNADGHDLNNCHNTRRILNEHKANQKPRLEAKDSSKSSSTPAARA
ncbi:hypothetical protein VP01_3768g1, partial [Puccinia sorghi]